MLGASPHPQSTSVDQRAVLIADDDPIIRKLVEATLTGTDFTVLQASDGDQALRLLYVHRPVAAILDVNMPGRDGLRLTRIIRSDPSLAGVTVLLLTNNTAQADQLAGIAAGADYYVAKPFAPLALLRLLEDVSAFPAWPGHAQPII
jgi:DNA-binding response OmpR family regulator